MMITIFQGSPLTRWSTLENCRACVLERLSSVAIATLACDCNIFEKRDLCSLENRAASSRECFVVTTIRKSRELVQTRSSRCRTEIRRLIQVCKVPASIAPLLGVSTLRWVEARTLLVSGRGVPAPLSKRSCVVYQGQPRCDPKTLGIHLDQRREIGAWIRSREVKCALPQRASVLELDCICKLLCLNENKASPKFSCNI